MDDESTYETTPVCLDELVTVWGQYDPRHRWNGWLMPRIDPWAAERTLIAIAAEHTATGEPDRISWAWGSNGRLTLVETYGDGPDDQYTETYEPDTDGLVALGAGGWVWAEDDDDDSHARANKTA